MERSDDSDGSQLDGLPRRWPHEGVHDHQAQAATTPNSASFTSTHSGEEKLVPPSSTPSNPQAGLSPIGTGIDKPAGIPPPAAAETYGGELVASPENLNKPLPEAPEAPEYTENPEDLKEHLTTVPPISSSKRTTSAVLEDPRIKDLGWRDNVPRPDPLILGMDNVSLFTLIRRFNKQVHHVRAIPPPPPGLLDLEIAADEEFSPDKLRATLERLYMTVIVGAAAVGKHVARLRSWNEPRRTTTFALVYFASWHLHLLAFSLLSTLLFLAFSPSARRVLFPPATLAAVSAASGNLQVPRAGTIHGAGDSLMGAPEVHRGEAVEREAAHFVASIAAIGTGTVLGQGGAAPGEVRGDGLGDAPTEMQVETGAEGTRERASEDSFAGALKAKNIKDAAGAPGVTEDPAAAVTKTSVEGAVWERMRPMLCVLADVVDGWERVANALEPVPPFPKYAARLRMAAVLVPLLVASFVIPATVVLRVVSFLVGVMFFSQPLLSRAIRELNRRAPHWHERVELRRTILKGVPTNAQLTLTLLRIAEQANAPLHPLPIPRPSQTMDAARAAQPGPEHLPQVAEQLKEHNFAFDADNYEVEGVQGSSAHAGGDTETSSSWTDEGTYVDDSCSTDRESVDGGSATSAGTGTEGNVKGEKMEKGETRKKRRSKLVGFMKKTTRAGVGGVLGVDHIKVKAGDEHARRRLGAVGSKGDDCGADRLQGAAGEREGEKQTETTETTETTQREGEAEVREREGPTGFPARVHGTKGRVLVVSRAASPCVSFVAEKPLRAALGKGEDIEGIEGEFSVGVADIVVLRKVGGFGWKGKFVVGWASGRDVLDGLEIVDRWGGRRVITAVKGRDELFNRLVAMGAQKWECL